MDTYRAAIIASGEVETLRDKLSEALIRLHELLKGRLGRQLELAGLSAASLEGSVCYVPGGLVLDFRMPDGDTKRINLDALVDSLESNSCVLGGPSPALIKQRK